jgi:hypothetical protein
VRIIGCGHRHRGGDKFLNYFNFGYIILNAPCVWINPFETRAQQPVRVRDDWLKIAYKHWLKIRSYVMLGDFGSHTWVD